MAQRPALSWPQSGGWAGLCRGPRPDPALCLCEQVQSGQDPWAVRKAHLGTGTRIGDPGPLHCGMRTRALRLIPGGACSDSRGDWWTPELETGSVPWWKDSLSPLGITAGAGLGLAAGPPGLGPALRVQQGPCLCGEPASACPPGPPETGSDRLREHSDLAADTPFGREPCLQVSLAFQQGSYHPWGHGAL